MPAGMAAVNDRKSFGIILNTVQHALKADPGLTLETLADLGFSFVEFGREPAPGFLDILNANGLYAVAGGSSMQQLLTRTSEWLSLCELHHKPYLICYWPWTEDKARYLREDYLLAAARLNQIGKESAKRNIRLAFHNHDGEFAPLPDAPGCGYDVLLAETDPAFVTMELDLYWAVKGGGDPARYYRDFPGRFELAHVKDLDAGTGAMCPPGLGMVPFAAYFQLAENAGLRHPILEQDNNVTDEWATARQGARYLKKSRFR